MSNVAEFPNLSSHVDNLNAVLLYVCRVHAQMQRVSPIPQAQNHNSQLQVQSKSQRNMILLVKQSRKSTTSIPHQAALEQFFCTEMQ